MQESRRMNELDERGRRNVVIGGRIAGTRGDEHEERSKPFAAGVDEIARHLADERDVTRELLGNAHVDGLEVVGDQVPDLVERHARFLALQGIASKPGTWVGVAVPAATIVVLPSCFAALSPQAKTLPSDCNA